MIEVAEQDTDRPTSKKSHSEQSGLRKKSRHVASQWAAPWTVQLLRLRACARRALMIAAAPTYVGPVRPSCQRKAALFSQVSKLLQARGSACLQVHNQRRSLHVLVGIRRVMRTI